MKKHLLFLFLLVAMSSHAQLRTGLLVGGGSMILIRWLMSKCLNQKMSGLTEVVLRRTMRIFHSPCLLPLIIRS